MKLTIASSKLMNPLHIFTRKTKKAASSAFTQGEMPLPRQLLIAATFKCAAKCPHCYLLQQDKQIFSEQTVMAEDLFQRILDSPFINDISVTTFHGGEALLHPSLFDWMDQAHRRGLPKIKTITNGLSLQTDRIVENLLEREYLAALNVSLDAITPEAFCRAKGIKNCDFEKICRQVKRIADRFRGTQTSISGSFVTYRLDTEETREIIRFGESLGLHNLTLRAFHTATDHAVRQSQAQQIKEVMTISDQIMNQTDYQINVKIKLPFMATKPAFFCRSLAHYLCIGANGTLAPCCHIPWDPKYGTFAEADKNPINSPSIVAMREKFVQAAARNDQDLVPAPCRFCTKRAKGKMVFAADTKQWTRKPKKNPVNPV
ncbi:MAG: radical SAM protein [Desulfobacterales bacterium]|nr:radical SAM protein [Desulfobacterales bacterium]